MYLPEWTGQHGQITIRQLWSHTSGLAGDHACLADGTITLAQCVEQIRQAPMLAGPGAQFYYGGASMQVAGRIAEVVTGQSWVDLFNERIATPLQMTSTSWVPVGANPRIGGGLFTTLDDYTNFMSMIAAGGTFDGATVLEPATVATMQLDQTAGALIAYSPHPDTRRYGLGEWRDVVDTGGAAIQLSSQGAFGYSPWLDVQRGYFAVFMVQASLAQVYLLAGTLQQLARDSVTGDGDGCSSDEEAGGTPALGGARDPAARWDFYEVNASLRIDAVDIGLVRANFNPSGPVPPEDAIFDRSAGAASWAPGPPDNKINAIDIGLVRASFNHTCAAQP
jgi:CubicO group peptidase (beta-lactamase class C family)